MADQGRLGRKSKAGFYAYDASGKRDGPLARARRALPPAAEQPDLPRSSTG
jgi:3-hydroxyacyl-CoA dehydrogenase / enoyl-CoA hydratase / 3-hydroxybutyryl-CoA epimerase